MEMECLCKDFQQGKYSGKRNKGKGPEAKGCLEGQKFSKEGTE